MCKFHKDEQTPVVPPYLVKNDPLFYHFLQLISATLKKWFRIFSVLQGSQHPSLSVKID